MLHWKSLVVHLQQLFFAGAPENAGPTPEPAQTAQTHHTRAQTILQPTGAQIWGCW